MNEPGRRCDRSRPQTLSVPMGNSSRPRHAAGLLQGSPGTEHLGRVAPAAGLVHRRPPRLPAQQSGRQRQTPGRTAVLGRAGPRPGVQLPHGTATTRGPVSSSSPGRQRPGTACITCTAATGFWKFREPGRHRRAWGECKNACSRTAGGRRGGTRILGSSVGNSNSRSGGWRGPTGQC